MTWIQGKSVLITGGNGGIGRATALALATAGAHVTIACRNRERGEEARAAIERSADTRVEVLDLDLASLASVRAAATEFASRHTTFDVLVNNAGVAALGRRRTTDDGFERQFGVNHLGHFLLTTLLADRISHRVVNVSSAGYGLAKDGLRWHDLQWELEYDGWQAYGASKLCNLYFTWELADRLHHRGITVNAAHPGFVDTELGRRRPEEGGKPRADVPSATAEIESPTTIDVAALGTPLTAEEGARTPVMLASDPALAGVTGAYVDDHQRRVDDLGPIAHDRAASKRLWDLSNELVSHPPHR